MGNLFKINHCTDFLRIGAPDIEYIIVHNVVFTFAEDFSVALEGECHCKIVVVCRVEVDRLRLGVGCKLVAE
jgi:hypothetical protein